MKYLVCVDGSESSDVAIDVMVKLNKPGDDAIVLTVGSKDYNPKKSSKEEDPEVLADRYVAKLTELGIENAMRVVVEGDPRSVICSQAKELGVDMIVMGARGLGTLKKILLGSVSEYVSAHASCTVIIAQNKSHEGGNCAPFFS